MRRIIFVAGAIACITAASSLAHEGNDALAVWYRSLETPEGGSCCNMNDCGPVEARVAQDGWEIKVGKKWLAVPADRILKRENMDGRPIGCLLNEVILCFVPPAGV